MINAVILFFSHTKILIPIWELFWVNNFVTTRLETSHVSQIHFKPEECHPQPKLEF